MSPLNIQKAIGAVGTKKIAVILCEFSSLGSVTTSGGMSILSLSSIQNNLNNVKNFYTEASYGQLTLNFTFVSTTPYIADYSMSSYGYPDSNESGDSLIREMIGNAGIYKGSGTGQYDAVMVIHSGYGNESTSRSGDIWSALYSFTSMNGFTEGMIMPESELSASPLGVMCHEMGHQLGLPDLYDSATGESRIGEWCLMDMGTWLNNGYSPSHPSVWCKQLLGWVTPTTTSASAGTVSLTPIEASNSARKIEIPTASEPDKEYFLLEYRSRSSGSYDTQLPGEGVVIWHIDEGTIDGTSFDNRMQLNSINNYSHNTVDIIPADSTHPRDNSGDSSDPWPGTKHTFSTPDSDSYNGFSSGINTTGFTVSGGSMNFALTQIAAASVASIDKIVNYPNPAGPLYPANLTRKQDTVTTLVFHFARAPQELQVDIYDIAGELVKQIPRNEITFNVGPSGDYRWVYEYDWNGKNTNGEAVASGLYFYRVKADGKIKVGKMAISR